MSQFDVLFILRGSRPGLYVTGAGAHPCGIMDASGFDAAATLRRDLLRQRLHLSAGRPS